MDFKAFFFGLSVAEREAFAQRAGTSRGLLTQVAYRNKAVELGFADVLCALSEWAVTLDGVPLTDNAQRQRRIREQAAATHVQELSASRPDAANLPAIEVRDAA